MSEYAGRIAIGVSVVLVVSVVFAFELNYFLPANVSSSSQSTNISTSPVLNVSSWFGNEAFPAGCGNMNFNSWGARDGYNTSVYVSSSNLPGVALLGSKVCIYVHLQNVKNESTSPPAGEDLYITNINARNTSIPSGTIFFRGECTVPASYSGSFGPSSTGWNCNIVWDTSQSYGGVLPNAVWPDVYTAYATISFSNSATVIKQPAGFRFAPEPHTSTTWFGNGAPPSECSNSTVMSYSMVDGYRLEIYSPSQPVPAGGGLCIHTRLLNLDNSSTSLPANETLMVTSSSTPGFDYFQAVCFPASHPGSFGPNGTSWNCAASWNTADYAHPANSAPPDAYQVLVVARLSNSSTVVTGSSNIHLLLSEESSTTSNTASRFGCPGPFKLESPTQNSSLFLRIVTGQGSVIPANNGTVFVTHTAPASANGQSGTWNYCLRLEGNSTGYTPLVGNGTLPAAGSYNMTLFAGYGQGPGYQGSIPAVNVEPNSTVYVTITVPSGEVTILDCPEAGACSTTTSTATTLSGG